MGAGTTRISARTWRTVGSLAAVALVIAALGSGHSGSSEGTSSGPSSYPTPVSVPGDAAQDPAADLERQRQAVQALQEGSQARFGAEIGAANSYTP
jgi:hypothetical protein